MFYVGLKARKLTQLLSMLPVLICVLSFNRFELLILLIFTSIHAVDATGYL